MIRHLALLALLVWCLPGCRREGSCEQDSQCKENELCCASVCKDVATDVEHCGACAQSCSFAHASPVCVSGVCQVERCEAGFGDCNADPRDGCEASFAFSANACGGCGRVCSPPNAQGMCNASQCGVGSCTPGYADCDGAFGNGCEVNITSDSKHCGACGRACAPSQAQPVCRAGICQVGTCDKGWDDCNADPADGCEVSLTKADAHCGACGKACAVGLGCVEGQCQPQGTLIIYGGSKDHQSLAESKVYLFDLATKKFTELIVAGGPGARMGHVATWDATARRMLVFGGHDGNWSGDDQVYALSFAVDPPVWTKLATRGTPPSARFWHAAAQDRVGGKWYVFGGVQLNGEDANDLFVLDLASLTWSKLAPAGTSIPAPRTGSVAAFDANARKLILYGGCPIDGEEEFDDLWTLDLSAPSPSWSKVVLTPAPPPLSGATFIEGSAPLALFGGVKAISTQPDLSSDLWFLSLATPGGWSKQTVTPRPGARWFAASAQIAGQLMVYGGDASFDFAKGLNDLWSYDPVKKKWTELAANTAQGPVGRFSATLIPLP